jgi:hypothetical protein
VYCDPVSIAARLTGDPLPRPPWLRPDFAHRSGNRESDTRHNGDESWQDRAVDAAFLDDFAHLWLQGWNAHDGEAVAALCTEEVEFSDPLLGTVFPDYRFEEPERPCLSRDVAKAIVPGRMIATNTGPIDPPCFAPTGRSIIV